MSEHHDEGHDSFVKGDECITRNRKWRKAVAFGSLVAIPVAGTLVGLLLAWWFELPPFIGWSFGLAAGGYGAWIAWGNSTVENEATIAFLTLDPLASLFPSLANTCGLTTIVAYGPGKHFCFWWEQRSRDNVVSLVETAEPVSILVQTESGELTLTGDIRLRPDLAHLHEFINGVASVASDATGLVGAFVVGKISGNNKKLREALKEIGTINDALREEFQKHKTSSVTKFEERFGVTVGDVTISQVLPSDQVREVLGHVTESELMDEMVAKSFGYNNINQLMKAVKKGGPDNPTFAQVNQVRTQKMAGSGNLQGMDLKDHTFNLNLSGLDSLTPEIAAAFGTALGMYGKPRPGTRQSQNRKQNPRP